ncbi:hypothetical protein E2C01_021358 [Portunus trituberculatus]|uniref:Uncharacterized protein n=1 Tax=Portunus trituberculatus TaxID=210409 RepID=A0A5B7E4G4_PORTR|nr:hypothetical protein [Portunus trituberculatus]
MSLKVMRQTEHWSLGSSWRHGRSQLSVAVSRNTKSGSCGRCGAAGCVSLSYRSPPPETI